MTKFSDENTAFRFLVKRIESLYNKLFHGMVVVIAIASISREQIACCIVQKPLTTSWIDRVASCESIATRSQTSFLSNPPPPPWVL